MGDWITGWSEGFVEWAGALGWPTEACLRLALAVFAGGLIGLEREIRVRHAGFRTMILVCIGSALVMVVSQRLPYGDWPVLDGQNRVVVDPGRIAYGIMTGVGFLGAGTIIERRGKARGLTTASAIWCVAAIGMTIGFGLYAVAALATVLVLLTLWLLDHFEDMLPVRRLREVTVRSPYRPGVVREVIRLFTESGFRVQRAAMDRAGDDVEISVSFDYGPSADYFAFETRLETDHPEMRVERSREI